MIKISIKKIAVAAITAVMAISVIMPIGFADDSIRLEWSGKTDFSGVQGQDNWYYQMNSGSGYVDIDYEEANKQYKNSSNFITATNFHPGIGIYSARGWKAPYTGTVRILPDGNVRMNSSQTVGTCVYVDIYKNDECLWEKTMQISDNVGYTYNMEVEVKAGDMIYFRVGCDDYRNCNTYWVPLVKYERAAIFTDNNKNSVTAFADLKDSTSVSCTFYDLEKITDDAMVYLVIFDKDNTMKRIEEANIDTDNWETRTCTISSDINFDTDGLDGGSLQLLVISAENERFYSLLNKSVITLN